LVISQSWGPEIDPSLSIRETPDSIKKINK
jgi:hypothetical protein